MGERLVHGDEVTDSLLVTLERCDVVGAQREFARQHVCPHECDAGALTRKERRRMRGVAGNRTRPRDHDGM